MIVNKPEAPRLGPLCLAADGATGTREKLESSPRTPYLPGGHEEHSPRAAKPTRMARPPRMVCDFNPPLTGLEVHDADGIYPLIDDDEETRAAS